MKTWEKIMEQVKTLIGEGLDKLYDRVELLAKIKDDPIYHTDMTLAGKDAIEQLDLCLNDYFLNYATASEIMRLYPRKEQWLKGNIREMEREAIKDLEQTRRRQWVAHKNGEGEAPAEEPANEPRKRDSRFWKDSCHKAETKIEELESKLREQAGVIKAQSKEIKDLKELLKSLGQKRNRRHAMA